MSQYGFCLSSPVAAVLAATTLLTACSSVPEDRFVARDPGVRAGSGFAGGPIAALKGGEQKFYDAGLAAFLEVKSVRGTLAQTAAGLGPRFNLDSCAGCHMHPAPGGSSPLRNPQVAMATKGGATNKVPSFVEIGGPVREVRFKFRPDGSRDGRVHHLFTIAGRSDAPGCRISPPDFDAAARADNLSFRIPTPLYGAGLIEAIPQATIRANAAAQRAAKKALGIAGHVNEPDGQVARFGWKAQIGSLSLFAGEAYNVEMGVTNELFPAEFEDAAECGFNAQPEDQPAFDPGAAAAGISGTARFTSFMRFLAPPLPAPDTPAIVRGRALFTEVGCALCHTPSLRSGSASIEALRDRPVPLYSDLLVHKMGAGLADNIVQGYADADEFRTAPLWGLGQRIYFLHDGRTRDLVQAIRAHASERERAFAASEANQVVARFNALKPRDQQAVLDFLRAL